MHNRQHKINKFAMLNLVFLSLFLIICVFFWKKCKHRISLLANCPILVITPAILKNAHRIHDFTTKSLRKNHGTFQFKPPFFSKFGFLVTSDPANINYILSKNFSNYPKGPEFRKIFDILGDGMFNADGDLWKLHHKTTLSLFNHPDFHKMLQDTLRDKVEKRVIQVLDHMSDEGIEVDLQDIFRRLTFDNICLLLLDHDPHSLSVDLPCQPCEKAFTDSEEAIFYRHVLPHAIWKLQSWIGIGKEKGLSKAREALDHFIYTNISRKRQELLISTISKEEGDDKLDLFKAYMEIADKRMTGTPDKFLRDTLLSLLFAGRDTTSAALTWFFWLLTKNPLVESKILDELEDESWMLLKKKEDLGKLVYLHGALYEALRLFPPTSINHKSPQQADVLPSGHRVAKGSTILLSYYAMGRMESIWGKDCLEFKPERWINEKGGVKHVPSFKFPAFNAGPRSCLGKEMSVTQMKMVAATIIHHYRTEVVEGHQVVPVHDSVVMQMKYGLKVRLAKRTAASE